MGFASDEMRKLRESERSHQIRLAPRIEEKIQHDDHAVDLCKVECAESDDEDTTAEASATELDRLRELATEQQGVIEVLRQAVKERDRKLEQLSNKRRKEEFYKQWLELEPVAEVDDEEDHQNEEGDSALSSAPSSLSPQPGAGRCNNGSNSGITREAYESVLFEIEELQTKLLEEQQELGHAKCQVRDLEKALLQETQGSQQSKQILREKLRQAEERESSLIAEITDLREQNELLEFRVLELEESPNQRESPDPADSGIVSPEPIQLHYREQQQQQQETTKHRDRAVATVIPYTSNYTHQVLPTDPSKAPLSLQESGIFEEELVEDDMVDHVGSSTKPLASQSTQTEAPAGELLQEVQRLQELRVRIQERASKTPVSPTSDRKTDSAPPPLPFDFPVDFMPVRERIRELEDRVSSYESERKVSKIREEELLDENYRLTEQLYWLESEMKKATEFKENTSSVETMTESALKDQAVQCDQDIPCDGEVDSKYPGLMSSCQNLYKAAIQNSTENEPSASAVFNPESRPKSEPCADCAELWRDCDAKIHSLVRTELCLRQQIASLEHQEGAFFETLRQADATWAKLKADYEGKQREMSERLDAQVELNRALFDHLMKLNKSSEEEPMDVDVPTNNYLDKSVQIEVLPSKGCRCSQKRVTSSTVVRSDSKTSTISRTSINMATVDTLSAAGCDEIDTKSLPYTPIEPPPEMATEAKEETVSLPATMQESDCQNTVSKPCAEPLVSVDEASTDKKQIIYFRWR